MIDLRSDAVTQPTEEMWDAMRRARLGWAHVDEDPSVNELQSYAAALTGKEAAVFVPTGTMANLVALMSHTQPGDQVILEASSHIFWCEEWSFARICGLAPSPIRGDRGHMNPSDVRAAIHAQRFSHRPRTSLICLEKHPQYCGGSHSEACRSLCCLGSRPRTRNRDPHGRS